MTDLLFVRHASSCGNVKSISKSNINRYLLQTENPGLSDFGVLQVRQVREQTPKIRRFLRGQDIICCSNLLRTMETASFFYPKRKKIYVLPYLEEIPPWGYVAQYLGLDTENRVQDRATTMKRLKKLGHDISKFDWSIHDEITGGRFKIPDVGVFRRVVEPKLLEIFGRKKIVCVTHSHWMQEYLKQLNQYDNALSSRPIYQPRSCQRQDVIKKIGNCGMFLVNKSRKIVQHIYETSGVDDQGTCFILNERRHPKILKKSHVQRCSNPKIRNMAELID